MNSRQFSSRSAPNRPSACESGLMLMSRPGGSLTTSLRPIGRIERRDSTPLMLEQCGSAGKKNAAVNCGVSRDPALAGSRALESETALLREEDLDAPVLRLAHTERRWHAQIVVAATADRHIAARDAEGHHTSRHGIGAPLGEPLIVGV